MTKFKHNHNTRLINKTHQKKNTKQILSKKKKTWKAPTNVKLTPSPGSHKLINKTRAQSYYLYI